VHVSWKVCVVYMFIMHGTLNIKICGSVCVAGNITVLQNIKKSHKMKQNSLMEELHFDINVYKMAHIMAPCILEYKRSMSSACSREVTAFFQFRWQITCQTGSS
jgi:hypothetical protein